VITSADELVQRGLADPRVAALVAGGDWYLVGSRAVGFADEVSDWDTIVLSSVAVDALPANVVDEAFGINWPALSGPPTLAAHVRWRRAHGVELQLLSPSARRRREEDDLAVWAFELQHAVPLHLSAGIGGRYRADVAAAFDQVCPVLADAAYTAFRRSRNEAVATLPRGAQADQVVAAASCVRHAARFWMLALGVPHPADKWLLAALRRTDPVVVPVMETAVDLRVDPGTRFDALWRLWDAVDHHALAHGIAVEQMAGSPFLRRE
jgi:hypothetical protein